MNVYKYLGVDLDENLTMNNMIDSTFNEANRKVYLLKKIRPYITREIANRIYKTCILPILDYADFLMDSEGVSFIGKLDTIKKRCLRIIDFIPVHLLMNYAKFITTQVWKTDVRSICWW